MPNNLNFAVHLDTKEFDKNIREAEALAKKFNITMSTALDFSKKLKGLGTTPKQMADAYSKMITAQAKANTEAAKGNVLKEKANVERLKGVKLQQQITNAAKGTRGALSGINSELSVQSRLLSNVKTLFTTYVSVFAVKNFLQELAQVRGEFELQQVALRAIMQDAKAADKTFGQLKGLAIESPFTFSELASYAKMLSAYNIDNDELFDTTKRLADLSAGLGVDMQRIILAYGQVRSAEFLRGQEVRQFSEAGINLVGELAKQFSELEGRVVSAGETFDKISKREVPFAMVKKVLDDLTSEGGRFYDQQRIQAETTYGMLRKLSDTYMQMLNDIGQSNDGVIKGSIQLLLDLMKNWDGVARILKTVVVTYGTYKALNIVNNIWQQNQALARLIRMQGAATTAQHALNNAFKAANRANVVIGVLSALAGVFALFNKDAKSTVEIISDLGQKVAELEEPIVKINTLIAKYEQLSSITNRDIRENAELANTVQALSRALDGCVTSFDAQGRAIDINIRKAKELRDELIESTKILYQSDINDAKSKIEENEKEINKQNIRISEFEKRLSRENLPNRKWHEEQLEKARAAVAKLRIEQEKLRQAIADSEAAISDLNRKSLGEEGLVEWQKKFNEIINNLNIPKDFIGRFLISDYKTSRSDAINRIKSELETATDELETAKKLEIVDKDEIKRAEDYLAIVQKIASKFNISLDSNKKVESPEKQALEQIKAELQTLEKARSLYENLRKTQSEDEAFAEVDKRFGVKVDDASFNAARQDILNRLLALGDDARDVAIKLSIDIAKDASDKLKQQLDNAKTEYDEYLKNFDFYKSLRQSGMSKEQAIKLSFDVDSDSLPTIPEKLQEYISDTFKFGGKSVPQLDFSINADPIKAQLKALGIEWDSLTDKEKDAINAAIGYQQTAIKSAQDVQQALEEWGMEDFNIGEGGIYAINKLLHDLSMQEKKAKKRADELRLSNQLKYEEGNITEEVYNENLARIENLYDKELEYIKRNSQARLDGMAQSIADEFQSKSGYNKTLASKGNALFSGNYKAALKALRDFQKYGFTDEQKQRLRERGLDENVVAEATEKMLKAAKNEELAAKFNEASSAAATLSQAMTALGNEGLATAFSMMSNVAGIAGNIVSGNYMQAAGSMISMITNIIAQNKAANEAAAQSAWEYAEALKELNRERLLESASGIFGTNDMAQLKAYGKIMRDARESANSALSEKITASNFGRDFSMLGDYFGKNRFESITSDMRSGWQKFWGSSKNQISLVKSDIYDEFGNIDVDKLSAWYDAYSKGLSQKDKQFVEGLINDLQAYEEALEGMKDYISGIFGDLASDIADSMIESFKATGNAVADLEDVFDDLGETILKSLLQSMIMDKVLKEYEDKVFGLYEDFSKGGMSEEEFANKASGLLSEIEGATMNLGDFWNKILEYVKDTGLTNLTDENATSLGGTIQGITENTAELLGSYLNAIRQAVLKQYPQFVYANNTLIGIWGEMEEFYPTCTEYLHNIEAHSANILETTKEILGVLKGVVSPSGYKLRIE